jgi:ribose 5-phosphate isomerase A
MRRGVLAGTMEGVTDHDQEKHAAAARAALLVEPGMRVGLGTGSTVGFLLPALAAREIDVVCVATSPETERAARSLGLTLACFEPEGGVESLDIAIDGADQIAGDHWLVKGGGGAHTREKLVACSAERFVVIASSDKPVTRLHVPVPVELSRFGLLSTLRRLGDARVRDGWPESPDGGVIADWFGTAGLDTVEPAGDIADPAAVASFLESTAGVVGHGLFAPSLVSEVIIGRPDGSVEHHHGELR